MHELKTLIDISAGTRLPQYEEEIFTDTELTEYYLHKLCDQYEWYYHGHSAPRMAYRYARYVMKFRWPEAEAIIATDPGWACYYASCVMESRWPEAEAVIAESNYREWYNDEFGTKL